MTKDDEKIEDWMYKFAWNGYNIAQKGNETVDTKAKNIINFAGTLIPIITGFFLLTENSLNIPKFSYILLGSSLVFLIGTILFAFKTMRISDKNIISVENLFNVCNTTDLDEIKFNTSKTIARWQKRLIEINKNKSKYLNLSYKLFVIALILISCSALYIIAILYMNN